MRRKITRVMLIVLLGGLLLSAGEQAPAEGVVYQVAGAVTAVSPAGARRLLKSRDRVYAGEIVETADKASCKISMGDGAEITVPARSRIQINDSRTNPNGHSSIAIYAGWIWAKIAGQDGKTGFETETATTVVGVRGTEFGSGIRPDGVSRVVVTKGTVSSSFGSSNVPVSAGKTLDVGLDGKSESKGGAGDQKSWQDFQSKGLGNLRGGSGALAGMMMQGMKNSRGALDARMGSLRVQFGKFKALVKDIEQRSRIIVPEADKKKAGKEAASLLGNARKAQILANRMRANVELLRAALEDLKNHPSSYPADGINALHQAGGELNKSDPDKYLRGVMDELARMSEALEDDILRLDLAPGLERTPSRKKVQHIEDKSRELGMKGPGDTPPGHERGPERDSTPDLPPLFEPEPHQPEPEPEPPHQPEPPPGPDQRPGYEYD